MSPAALLLLIFLPVSADTLAPPPGAVLDAAPEIPPGGLAHLTAPTLDAGVAAWRAGDHRRAVFLLEGWLASGQGPWGRQRAAGQFLLGWIHFRDGRYNRASENFTQVRYSGGPLAPFGAYYEALADHRRGRHAVAAGECRAYRERWPDGYHAEACLLLMGDAYVAAGYHDPAVKAYKEWLKDKPDSPMEELIQLQLARAAAKTDPRRGAEQLRWLVLSHRYGANARGAYESLQELLEQGVQPDALDPLYAERLRATSLRSCGHSEEAWSLYCHLEEHHADDDMTRSWLEAQARSFRWGTRQYLLLADEMSAEYDEAPSGELAWRIFRTLWRAGAWPRAANWAEQSLQAHKGHYRWTWGRDQVAFAWQLAGDYTKAREHWDALADVGGGAGQTARWYGGFTSYMAGDYPAAEERLTATIDEGGAYATAARYYRAKARIAAGDEAGAREDFQHILEHDPWSWYGQLVQSRLRPAPADPDPALHRSGRWPAPDRDSPPAPTPPARAERAVPAAGALRSEATGQAPPERDLRWSALRWSPQPVSAAAAPDRPRAPAPTPDRPTPLDQVLAAGDLDNTMFDPAAARATFYRIAEANKDRFEHLPAALDLAGVGIYELSAPLVGRAYASWKRRRTGGITLSQWRDIFLYAGDYHDATRATAGLQASAGDPQQVIDALRLHYPTAYREEVVHWAREYDLDPLLLLGMMRQESLYQTWAVSSAGATGLMQVMPQTGARIADALGESSYSPISLEDPLVSIRYGAWYLHKLMERFGGVWPLAVASYNTGPTNLSTFWGARRDTITVDDLVEQIPYRETRDYVKRITEHYAHYLSLYGPEGATLHIPLETAGDHREVIDF